MDCFRRFLWWAAAVIGAPLALVGVAIILAAAAVAAVLVGPPAAVMWATRPR